MKKKFALVFTFALLVSILCLAALLIIEKAYDMDTSLDRVDWRYFYGFWGFILLGLLAAVGLALTAIVALVQWTTTLESKGSK